VRTIRAILAVALLIPGLARAELKDDSELVRLDEFATRYPDDPDLAWAYITALEERALADRAIEKLQAFRTRWPTRRPEAAMELGRLLYSRGSYEEALGALEDGIYQEPRTASSRLYRGLSLRALERRDEAENEFRVAAVLEPALEPETLLLRAIGKLEVGEDDKGEALLREAIALDPSGEIGKRAKFLLGAGADAPTSGKRVTFRAYSGVEIDTNVTLDSGTSLSASTDESDSRMVWGAGLQFRALESERGHLTLGYDYGESSHEDLKTYNLQNHVVYASALLKASNRLMLRLDGIAADAHLDNQRYLRSWSVEPNFFLNLGERAGLSRLYARVERLNYHEAPLFKSLEQGGTTYSLGIKHYISLPWPRQAWASLGTELSRLNSTASRDALGFKGAFDNRRGDGELRLHLPLVWQLEADVIGRYVSERYVNRNIVDRLAQPGRADHRRDRTRELSVALTRPLTGRTKIELRWHGIRQHSNVDVYDYNRQIMGVYLRAEI
jgi:tetratricopeptide (TPR) repeat protein